MWKIPRENWSCAKSRSSCGVELPRLMCVEMGGRRDATVAKGDEGSQVGLSGSVLGALGSSVGILYCPGEGMMYSVGGGGDLGFLPSLLASFCRRKTSPARLTSVRPQMIAMRQSSGA